MLKKVLLLVAVLLSSTLLGCTKNETPKTAEKFVLPETDNVVFLVIDTLRADHLSFYGYPKETAPFLASLANRSVIFEQAIAGCSSTAPSMASVFTSLLPSEHGVNTGLITTQNMSKKLGGAITTNRIPEELLTIPELMVEKGFQTFGVADNLNISQEMGFTQGFSKFRVFRYDGAPQVNRVMQEWEGELKATGKKFIYLHYMDPHAPYHRRAPWFQKSDNPKQNVINAYDSEIAYADKHIEELFQKFGWLENSLVVFLSDHGEEFWEHGDKGHDKTLYREVIHVPLMFYHRSLNQRRVREAVHTYDVMPTLAELFGHERNAKWRGISLLPYFKSGEPKARPLISELLRRPEHVRDAKRSLVHEDMHYIRTFKDTQGVKSQEVFDWAKDKAEKNNLAEQFESRTKELSAVMDETLKSGTAYQTEVDVELDAQGLEHLRSLGYVD
jgi:arylsulfatase A-like enzyme